MRIRTTRVPLAIAGLALISTTLTLGRTGVTRPGPPSGRPVVRDRRRPRGRRLRARRLR